jgi:hypothetical protein
MKSAKCKVQSAACEERAPAHNCLATRALGLALHFAPCTLHLLLSALLLLLTLAQPADAENIGTITLPENFPELQMNQPFKSLLDPPPLNNSWAQPGHRPLGVHLDNYALTAEQIDAAQNTGCGLVRLAIPMEQFISEAQPDWAVLDQVISRLKRANFEILPVLTAKAAVPEFYIEFCRNIAARYGETFQYYQLLDNINYAIGLQSRDYADLASRARAAITLADPGALIVSGGIRGADMAYLDMLDNQHALGSLDVLAFNLLPPKDGIESVGAVRSEHCLPSMQDAIAWARQHGKRVWVTSFGVSTAYNWVGVDQPEQASMYARGALYLGYIGVERIIFAAIQDSDPDQQQPARCCGLLDVYGAPKASYFAMRTLNRAIAGAYHIAPPFPYQGWTYEQPEAKDLLIADELKNEPGIDALSAFQVHNLQVFAFWFYAPEPQEYRMIYWLSSQSSRPTLITLNLGLIGLTPLDRFILLDNAPLPVAYEFAQNFLYIPYQPLDEIPGVIRFEVNEHGRAG